MSGDIVQIALPAAALVVIFNFVIALVNNKRNSSSNGESLTLLKNVLEEQKVCRECLVELKLSSIRQTDILSDMKDVLIRLANNR
jgi:hypothetical protein